MMSTVEAPAIEMLDPDDIPELTSHDRCDRHASGVAQAYVRILIRIVDGRPHYLDLCYHCVNLLEAELIMYPHRRDQREDLAVKP
jgi:hypothetical protein